MHVCIQGCSSLQSSSKSKKVYTQSFDTVNAHVERGIQEANLSILDVFESPDTEMTTYRIGTSSKAHGSGSSPVGTRSVEHEEGKVIVRKLAEGKVKVKVENPDYHFTVPSHEKEDYQQRLFGILEQLDRPKHEG